MLYYVLMLSAAAVVLLASDVRSESGRWAAFFLLSAATGGVARLWLQSPLPQVWFEVAQLFNQIVTPYGVLVFSLVYAGGAAAALTKRRRLKLWLLLPPAAMLAYALLSGSLEPNYPLMLIWAAPYYLAACALLVASYLRETDRQLRRSRLITVVITVPTLLGVVAFIHVAKTIWPDFDFFGYISAFFVYSFAIALLCVFVYGVLGVKVRVESDSLAGAMKAAGMGTSLLNHTIKNEVGKIALSVENLRGAQDDNGREADEQLAVIERAAAHLMEMAGRIHSRTRDFAWNPARCDPAALMGEALEPLKERFAGQGVLVSEAYEETEALFADPVHLREAIGNVLANAADALEAGGLLEIKISKERRHIVLSVRDNGPGMPPELLERVWEPFFSTKQGKSNYGLGLSYVYQVLRKCGGRAEIESKPGSGTVVRLRITRSRR
ncbi:sensor histidine kinase [Cohnella hashimotonis]|uniref:histidine kinase n=1 Tax=Cohnella hashimotonis TaxID=2826895 RepID=A0ABT6TKC0_9BACL|nr:HAMP domain-containing sensor histidine kinase [Cohnella hashimotonis]MDI4647180.1 HAMP domain-containing sensor histidine kinase [Cohnella hashimotonis]